MDSELEERLRESVKDALPHLDGETLSALMELLKREGVKKDNDVRHMTIVLLKQVLDTVDATDLYVLFQNTHGANAEASRPTNASVPAASSARQFQPFSENRRRLELQQRAREELRRPVLSPYMPDIKEDSLLLPSGVREAIQRKRRPTEKARLDMVGRIVDHCRGTVPNLQRAMFNSLAKDLVLKFPKSFKDTAPVSDHGSDTLAYQMRNKYDNDKRPVGATKRKERQAPPEAYACINWNPPLPDEETEESQEATRCSLLEMFSVAKKDWHWREIRQKMNVTFHWQRKDINTGLEQPAPSKKKSRKSKAVSDEDVDNPPPTSLSVADIREKWPFLFTLKGLSQHFKLLTGVNFCEKLDDYVQEYGIQLIEWLATKSEALAKKKRNMDRAQRAGRAFTKYGAIFAMVSAQLKDEISSSIIFVESTTSFAELQDDDLVPATAPDTPLIAAAGTTIYSAEKYFILVDKKPVGTVKNIADAIKFMFQLYFVCHLKFIKANIGFMYFLQRVVAQICPQIGRNTDNPDTHKKAVDKLNKFSNAFAAYIQDLNDENVEGI